MTPQPPGSTVTLVTEKILYAGDSSLSTAAGYLAGILAHYCLKFDYVSSDQPIGPALSTSRYALYIISDYPVNNVELDDFGTLLEAVKDGAGLMMIGGWESFHGLGGQYSASPLADALPVRMQNCDDRVNSPQPCLIEKLRDHAITGDLPFDRPPTIGGYNRVQPRGGTTQILAARHLEVTVSSTGRYKFTKTHAAPLLVVGAFGRGRTAVFTSDVAPHWVGGLVDWGPKRIIAQASGAAEVEVGCHYAEFFARLVRWTMGQLD